MKKKYFLLLFLFVSTNIFSQQLPDFQLRLNPSLEYNFNKKWATTFDYVYCLDDNVNQFQGSFLQLGFDFSPSKKIKFGIGYRFTTSYVQDNHRFLAIAQYKRKYKQFAIGGAIRYEFQTDNFDSEYMQFFNEPTNTFREKLNFDYKVPNSKLSLSFSPEIFLRINQVGINYNRIRYDFGCKYDFKHGQTLGISIFFDDYADNSKADRFVLVTNYNLNLNNLFKKAKKAKKTKKTPQIVP